jgi:hypothetical protein
MHGPIAYTYEADYHCPACTLARFGRGSCGFIATSAEDGCESCLDSEGNPVGVIAPWDEWAEGPGESLVCGTCGDVIDETEPLPEPECSDCGADSPTHKLVTGAYEHLLCEDCAADYEDSEPIPEPPNPAQLTLGGV